MPLNRQNQPKSSCFDLARVLFWPGGHLDPPAIAKLSMGLE